MVKGTFIAFDFSWGYTYVKQDNQIAAFTTLVTVAIPGAPGNHRIQATDGYKGNGLQFEDEKQWEKA